MKIRYTKSYDNTVEKLKKHEKEKNNLEDIKEFIENSDSFKLLKNNPLALMYGFEPLKHQNTGFYSFNLSKNGGVIRLIVKPDDNEEKLFFVFVSVDHYKDFSPKKVKYYDE